MGKIVEDLTYEPAATPQRLSDKQAGYREPSETALAFAEKVQKACLLNVNLYDLLQDDVARLLDAFAAQQVAAREAEIAKAITGLWVDGYAPGTLSAILAIVNKSE